MSLTPVFDATLADAPADLWESSAIFPVPYDLSYEDRYSRFREADPEPVPPTVTLWSILKPRFMQ